MTYSIIKSNEEKEKALRLCKGKYQVDLILGIESLGGATLRGKASSYNIKYRNSRYNLLKRLTANGVKWHEEVGEHGKRILVIG